MEVKNKKKIKLGEVASIRTGLVLSRKEAQDKDYGYQYPAISLKNVSDDGIIKMSEIECFHATSDLKGEYFTCSGDILLRLSAPYSVVLITEREKGLLVPAHFAMIRTGEKIDPCYLHWLLGKSKKRFYQSASGGTMMGTISSGYIAEMSFDLPPIEKQRQLATLISLASREQELFDSLAAKKKKLVDAILEKIITE